MQNKQLEMAVEEMIYRIGYDETIAAIASIGYRKAIEQNSLVKDQKLYERSVSFTAVLNRNDVKTVSDFLSDKSNEGIAKFVLDCMAIDTVFSENSPTELCNLVIDLLKIQSGDEVCDFGCGAGAFLANVLLQGKEKPKVIGEEVNPELADVSRILLSLLGANKGKIETGNVVDSKLVGYSKAFTFPPFAIKMFTGSEYRVSRMCPSLTFSNRNGNEWIFIDRMLSGLANGGRAVAFVYGRSLFSQQDKTYRDFLLKKGLIESIIELPSNLLFNTGIKIYAIVFSAENTHVRLANAEDCVSASPRKKNILDVGKVLELLNSDKITRKSNKELESCENLTPSILTLEVKKPSNAKSLREISEIIAGCQYTASHFEEKFTDDENGLCLLTPNDIQNGMIELDSLRKIESDGNRLDKFLLKQGDVVITTKSSKVKTAVVDVKPDRKIIAIGGILIIRPNLSIINPTYLKIYLDSQNGQSALKKVQKGVVIMTINPKNLESLLVPVPNMIIQNSKAEKYNELLSTLAAYSYEMKKIEQKINEFSLEGEE